MSSDDSLDLSTTNWRPDNDGIGLDACSSAKSNFGNGKIILRDHLDPELPKRVESITHLEVDPGGTVRHVLATTLSGGGLHSLDLGI